MRGPQSWQTNRSRTLRVNDTKAEARLWRALRNRNLAGHKFVRREPLGPYFGHFVCREARLIVEVDGATHSEPAELAADAARSAYLEELGYRIRRITNDDVMKNIEGVLDGILLELERDRGEHGTRPTAIPEPAPHPDPLPARGERGH